MDPNEALKRIREIARKVQETSFDYESDSVNEMEEALETFLELDRWLLSGGFLPMEWADRIKPRPLLIESDDPWMNPTVIGKPPF